MAAPFTYNYSTKPYDMITQSLNISNLGSVYSEDLKYKWYLRHKPSNFEWDITSGCTENSASKSFSCTEFGSLTSESVINGVSNFKQNFALNLSQICGCDFEYNNTLCLNGTITSEGKCCLTNSVCFVLVLNHVNYI